MASSGAFCGAATARPFPRRLSAYHLCDTVEQTGPNLDHLSHRLGHKEAFLDSITLARRIVDIVEEKQASDIVLLDVREQTDIADYFIVGTVDTERQARAIENDLLETLRIQQNIRPLSIEGAERSGSEWMLLDYGDVIVHLLSEETRRLYQLEELWNKASVVVKVF
jgi:ribosome-associated protein